MLPAHATTTVVVAVGVSEHIGLAVAQDHPGTCVSVSELLPKSRQANKAANRPSRSFEFSVARVVPDRQAERVVARPNRRSRGNHAKEQTFGVSPQRERQQRP